MFESVPPRAVLALLALLSLAPARLEAQAKSLTHAGERRRYIVYTPESYGADSSRRLPVVLNFHGGGMTMAEQMLYTRMNRTADSAGFIVVYPQGVNSDWNVGFGMPYRGGTDDVGFTEALLDQLAKDYRIDTTRVYATGLSRGGFFCHRLAVELSHRIAAIATVGAPLPEPVRAQGMPRGDRHPVGVLLIHGTADRIVAYEGKPGGYLSADETRVYWATRSGADGATLITVKNGGHTWPGADPFNVGLSIGATSRDLDASARIWAFVSRFSRR